MPEPSQADWLRVGLGIVISGQLMLLSLAANLSDLSGDTEQRMHLAIGGLTLLGILLLGRELAEGLAEAWRRREVSLDAMFALAFVGGLAASIAGVLTDGPVFFEVATVVLCVHAVGRRLKARFWAQAIERLDEAGLFPTTANRVGADSVDIVDISALQAGDTVVLYDGERAPVGGEVTEGGGWLSTDSIDGALVPVWAQAGDRVPAGAALRDGTLRMTVRDVSVEPLVDRRAALIEAWSQAPRDTLASTLARRFVPVVITVSVVAGVVWTALAGPQQGFAVATAVLLVACPCGFGLATPVATWATSSQLATQGVRVQSPAALELLARVQSVVFDKTGTLTELAPRTTGSSPERVRRWLGAVQQWFDHPIARLLRSGGTSAPLVTDPMVLATGGVSARVFDEGTWRNIRIAPVHTGRDLGVWVDDQLASVIGVDEHPQLAVASTLAALVALGIDTQILTGDSADPELGIPCERSLSPSDKAARVRVLRKRGPVAFVGDRPNDLPALAEADVGIAVPSASPLVREVADVALDDLDRLPLAIEAARALHTRLRRLLWLSLTGNAIGITAAALGLLHPVAAALIMALTSLTVTLIAAPPEAS